MDNKYFIKKIHLENDLKNVFFYNTKDVDLCELINSEFIINTSKSEILLVEANSLKTYLS